MFAIFRNGRESQCAGTPPEGKIIQGRGINGSKGIAALEFALLLPLFLTILVGIIEYGWVFFVDLTLTNAVREGARAGSTKTAEELPEDVAIDTVKNYIEGAKLDVIWGGNNEVTAELLTDTDGNLTGELEVKSTIEFEPLIGFLPSAFLPNQLKSKATMRWELADISS